jgi:lipid-binding SYLF domain-containing protein
MKFLTLLFATSLVFSSTVYAASADKKRAKTLNMRSEVLASLYEEKPEAEQMIRVAEGYAVFSNIGINVVFFSAGGGTGVVHDNSNNKDTYMNMASAGFGLGLGVKDFRGIFIFHSRSALNRFVEYGWDFSGQADAAAKSGEKGLEENLAATAVNGVTLYQLTENGLALQATLQGTKYWKDKKLNK